MRKVLPISGLTIGRGVPNESNLPILVSLYAENFHTLKLKISQSGQNEIYSEDDGQSAFFFRERIRDHR